MYVFAVYDQQVEEYLQPNFFKTPAEAMRSFSDVVTQPDHQFNKHATDYTMFQLASYDPATGKFDVLDSPRVLANAWELLAREKEESPEIIEAA